MAEHIDHKVQQIYDLFRSVGFVLTTTNNPDDTFTIVAKCGNDKFKATADSQLRAITTLAVEVGLLPSAEDGFRRP